MTKIRSRFQRQAGTVLALIAVAIVPMLGAMALAVDIGFWFVVRNQLQNAADAGALAGAQGLAAAGGGQGSLGIVSDSKAYAKKVAVETANKNTAAIMGTWTLRPEEVEIIDGTIVKVSVTRPVRTFFGVLLGKDKVDISVQAAAMVTPISGEEGVDGSNGGGMRPWALLDQFAHGTECVPISNSDLDPKDKDYHGAFNPDFHVWRGVNARDRYKSAFDEEFEGVDLTREGDCGMVTGLIAPRDAKDLMQVRLKCFNCPGGDKTTGNPWLTPGNFGPIALGGRGGSNYEHNIVYGYEGVVRIGDVIDTETGSKVGPTRAGVNQLIDMDPGARLERTPGGQWRVVSPKYGINESPRIVPIPLYSVDWSPANGRSDFKVTSIASFFIEDTDGKNVWGRFVPARSVSTKPGTPPRDGGSGGKYLSTVQLIPPPE
jgi:hypothetical protein